MMSYCIYLRKSRSDIEAEQRGEGETLSRHRTALLQYAQRHALHIGAVYEEIVSGESIAARPVMRQLLTEVGERRWDGVLVMEVERLARGDTMDQGVVAQAFKYSETLIITPLKTYDPNNEYDEEYFEFGLFMSRREYKTIRRRLLRGREAAAREGKCLGRAPYGYRKVKLTGDKGYSMEIVGQEADTVRMIYDWYIDGILTCDGRRRLGIQAIAKRLNRLSVPAIRHDYWQKETVRDILTNPAYAGLIRWGYRKQQRRIGSDGRLISRLERNESCIVSEGLHEAIIPRERWERAQQLFAQQPPAPVGYRSAVKNPLSGLVVCSSCGRRMAMRKGSGGRPDYLVCGRRGCDTVSAPLHLVEKRLLDILGEWTGGYRVAPKEHASADAEDVGAAISRREKELFSCERRLERVQELTELDVYSAEEYVSRRAAIAAEMEVIRQELRRLTEQDKKTAPLPVARTLVEIYCELSSAAEKNRLLKEIVAHAEYSKTVSARFRGQRADAFDLVVYPRLAEKRVAACDEA